jgi:ornithine cyclodeaminase/alanine dehydrogenase-like protein (mu-crystallin family)
MLFLGDADIAKLLTMEETIETVEKAFKEYAKGNVVLPTRSTIVVGKHNGSISFMPSYLTELEAQATKIISIYPNNKEIGLPTTIAWIVVNDPVTGMVKAFMEATHLTAMRTGAITGVAAKYLAPEDSKTVAIFGAGVQGRTQTWAACSVRDIEKVYVYDLYKETRADWRELDTATIAESKLVIDDREGIELEAGDILIPIKEGAITWEHIHAELKELVSGIKAGRTPEDTITVFKSVGIAIQDSSVANLVLSKLGL